MDLLSRMRQNFDRAATDYDRLAEVQRLAAAELCRLLPDRDFPSVLDAGCGTGFLTEELLRHRNPRRLCLNDTSPNMLRLCRERLGRTDPLCLAADFLDLRLQEPVDLLAANMLFQWFADLPEAFRHASALLRPGGVFLLSLPVRPTFPELLKAMRRVRPRGPWPVLAMRGHREVLKALRQAGFVRIVSRVRTYRQTFPSALDFLRHMRRTGASYPSERPLSPAELRGLLEHYPTRRGRAAATWTILYARGERP